MKSYTDLDLPASLAVDGGIWVGKEIFISGVAGFIRFSVKLLNTHKEHVDLTRAIALLFDVRFEEDTVVRNTYTDSEWRDEERSGGMPFIQGQKFEMVIKIKEPHYEIDVDGEHFVDFKHRMEKELGSVLRIEGDASIKLVRFLSGNDPSAPMSPTYEPDNPSAQYIGPLKPGRVICVSGEAYDDAERVKINFENGDGIIALHFDMRFNIGSQKVVVRNSSDRNGWGPEEVGGGFPFEEGKLFNIVFKITSDRFIISVDGDHFTDYAHRILPLETIDKLSLSGSAKFKMVCL